MIKFTFNLACINCRYWPLSSYELIYKDWDEDLELTLLLRNSKNIVVVVRSLRGCHVELVL